MGSSESRFQGIEAHLSISIAHLGREWPKIAEIDLSTPTPISRYKLRDCYPKLVICQDNQVIVSTSIPYQQLSGPGNVHHYLQKKWADCYTSSFHLDVDPLFMAIAVAHCDLH